jgi:SAM-dependent methyltransferase
MQTDRITDIIDSKTFVRAEHVGCPLCGGNYPSRPIKAQFGMTAHVAICEKDRLAFQTPRPSPEATLAYMNWRWGSDDSYVRDVQAQLGRGRAQLEFVHSHANPPGTLLDFGAGSGSFVKVARDAGWSAEGVERSRTARANALERYDLNLLEELPEKQYDVITLWDVIEHLRAPADMLTTLYANLKPGGQIFIETGNWENWQRVVNGDKWHVYLLDHHFYFSPSSLGKIVSDAGYQDFRLLDVNRKKPGGFGAFKKMPRYTAHSWAAWMNAKLKWGNHGDIVTMIAVARKPL